MTSMALQRLNSEDVVRICEALAQPTRLQTYRLLVRYLPYGLPAGDIARLLAVPHNTLSTHLNHLERAGLVAARREGRSIIYAATSALLQEVVGWLLADMSASHEAANLSLAEPSFPQRRPDPMTDRVHNVLILCTGNSARSVLAEAILNREGKGRFRAFSAGSKPKGNPNPYALELLTSLGYETDSLRSKNWSEFSQAGAPQMDFVLTVCDSAAGEACPIWPGHPLTAHWGIADPATVDGTDAEKRAAFMEAYRRLASRITAFVNLPIDSLDLARLKEQLAGIGTMEGATDLAIAGKAA
jgi:arsenate reductase